MFVYVPEINFFIFVLDHIPSDLLKEVTPYLWPLSCIINFFISTFSGVWYKMNSLITYLASTHFFSALFLSQPSFLKQILQILWALYAFLYALLSGFCSTEFLLSKLPTTSRLQNTVDTFLPSFFTSHSFTVFFDDSSSYTMWENIKELCPQFLAILSDIAFLGDRVYFLNLMISILRKRKLRFRKKKKKNLP